jgi:UDP:flavonoid glycosyltransferase YjiC (YdhE family)
MARVHIVATAGAGGDLQPLLASAVALRDRGHEVSLVGDRSVERAVADLGLEVEALAPEYDLGPALMAAVRYAMRETDGDSTRAGPIIQQRMTAWAQAVASPAAASIRARNPDVLLTSLFGVEALMTVDPFCPWVVVNSTFYVGPNPPRPLEDDVSPRAIPLIARYASLLDAADLVLHATDQVFDFGFDRLPQGHHYVGPLGIWEPALPVPRYLDEPGPPWGLVTISSQIQDDLPLLEAALNATAGKDLRVVATIGTDRVPDEVASAPPNVRLERSLSHSAVLERAAVLVSHAGHGSVMKALWHGVPMVLVPWGRDQPGVAARAEALGTATVTEKNKADAEAIATAIDGCLANKQMHAAASQHSNRLANTAPPAAAADHVETLLT